MSDLLRRAGIALYPNPGWKADLAAALGVNLSTVKNWARGASRVPPGVWREIARRLNAADHPWLAHEATLAAERAESSRDSG